MTDSTPIVSKATGITVGLALALAATIGGPLFWLDSRFDEIEAKLLRIEISKKDRWSSTDMRDWISDFKDKNPSLKVPRVDRKN